MKKLLAIDFEFTGLNRENLELICCSIFDPEEGIYSIWLHHDKEAYETLRVKLEDYIDKGYTFLAYVVLAEGRAFRALGIKDYRAKFIDLNLEWVHILNHNHVEHCGQHLGQKGEVITVRKPKPKRFRREGDPPVGAPSKSMAGCVFRLLGERVDTERKDRIRTLCIKGGPFSPELKIETMEYCDSDLDHLHNLYYKMLEVYERLYRRHFDKELVIKEMLTRGEYALRSCQIESTGYPVHLERMKNFTSNAPRVLESLQHDIFKKYPEAAAFTWQTKTNHYKMNTRNIKQWVKDQKFHSWTQTAKREISLSKDAFGEHFNSQSKGFGGDFYRYLKTKSSMNGFTVKVASPTGFTSITKIKARTIYDCIDGSDDRVRTSMKIYGTQTSRSAPPATSFIPAKAKVFRSLIEEKQGMAVISIDYSSQEFLIAGLLANDKNKIEAYGDSKKGDPYMSTAVFSGGAPEGATKATHGDIRAAYKIVVLSVSYGRGAAGLADKLTRDLGKTFTEAQAGMLIDKFHRAYPKWSMWREQLWDNYQMKGFMKLRDGWTLFKDQDSERSVQNFPVQGAGAAIMRASVAHAQEAGLDLIFTLHDALYGVCKDDNIAESINLLGTAMRQGFMDYFPENPEGAGRIRLDGDAWCPNKEAHGVVKTDFGPVNVVGRHIEEGTEEAYEQLKKYFEKPAEKGLLSLM